MKYGDIKEGVGRITKQNQTVDVGPNEISIQAAKFGNKVDKDGRPANMKKKVKGSKTNVLFNLGMTESVDNLYESVLYYRQMKENLGEIAQATEIYVDMDGVLADFFGEWAKLMKVDHFSKIDKEHKIGDALQAIRDTDEFWLNLPMLPQAKQLLSVIKQIKGEYNICSSPLADDPNSEPHKREWIKKNLAFFPPKEVIITHNKPQYATKEDGTPNILIDDFGKNVDAWEAAGGTAFKYKDHKFERTANAIKQHMQEPVTEDKETNKKTQDAATQKAKPYDIPIRKDIADLIIQSYPELEKIWVTSDQYGIVGTKLKNGPDVLKLQRQLKKDGYPINVDGKAGEKTDKMFKHWLGNVIYYIKHDYLGESVVKDKLIVKADNGKVYDISKFPGTLQEKVKSFKEAIAKIYAKSNADVPSFKFYLNDKFMGQIDNDGNNYKKVPGEEDLDALAKRMRKESIEENFADGKKKGKSRPGRVKRSGASCNGSVTELRAKAKKASGERAKMYHWCANMKSGRS